VVEEVVLFKNLRFKSAGGALRPSRDPRVPEIFGNKPVIERERALGKGRAKAGKPVLAMSFNFRVKTQEEEKPVCLLQTGGAMQRACPDGYARKPSV